jgi:hypothetical protein
MQGWSNCQATLVGQQQVLFCELMAAIGEFEYLLAGCSLDGRSGSTPDER